MTIKYKKDLGSITAFIFEEDKYVSMCRMTYGNNTWSISEWYTESDNRHQGYGKQALKAVVTWLLDNNITAIDIRYNWNKDNDYVKCWIEKHFDPIVILDDFEIVIYKLNTEKFFKYIED